MEPRKIQFHIDYTAPLAERFVALVPTRNSEEAYRLAASTFNSLIRKIDLEVAVNE